MHVRVLPEPEGVARKAILRALELRETERTAPGRSAWWHAGVREGLQESARPGGYVRDSS